MQSQRIEASVLVTHTRTEEQKWSEVIFFLHYLAQLGYETGSRLSRCMINGRMPCCACAMLNTKRLAKHDVIVAYPP